MTTLFWFAVGVFAGWFFLPTPQWAKNLLTELLAKVPFLSAFVKKD